MKIRKTGWALLGLALLLPCRVWAQDDQIELELVSAEDYVEIEESRTEKAGDSEAKDDLLEDLVEAEDLSGLEVSGQKEDKKESIIPTGTTVMVDEDEDAITFDPKDVIEISTDDAKEFITDHFVYWAFDRIDRQVLASIVYDTNYIGDSGRFYVPDLGVNVAIYYANEMHAPFAQKIVDEEDAGVYTPHIGGEPYLADHSSQAFGGLHYCQVGMMAYWKHVDRVDVFYCTRTCNGSNDGLYIYDDLGENCFFQNEGGMFTYTCQEDWKHVSVAFWQPVGTIWM